jgi:tetratricopeptide (TPR) repeat protein
MRARRRAGLASSVLALALTGCVAQEGRLAPDLPTGRPSRVELVDTPFFPQRDYQCGPAALATLLASAGITVQPDQLVAEVYIPGRQGSLQAEMIAATRSRGLVPYVLSPSLEALLAQLAAGQPVLVLQKTGAGPWPGWHYAVVVGYDTQTQRVVLRSGTEARLEMPASRFLATWDRAGRWALVALRPGTLPAEADLARYMQAAAGLEAVGQGEAARRAYEAAASHWPTEPLPRLGLANLAYGQGDLAAAEVGFRAAIERAPNDPVARNNRAAVLLELGCPGAARREIDNATVLAASGPHEHTVAHTRREIETAGGSDGAGCPADSAPAHSPP